MSRRHPTTPVAETPQAPPEDLAPAGADQTPTSTGGPAAPPVDPDALTDGAGMAPEETAPPTPEGTVGGPGSSSQDPPTDPPVVTDDEQTAARAAALAALQAGTVDGANESPRGGGEGDPAPQLPTLSGVVHQWGGDVACVVLFDVYSEMLPSFDGKRRHASAGKGDVVYIAEDRAERGVGLKALRRLDG